MMNTMKTFAALTFACTLTACGAPTISAPLPLASPVEPSALPAHAKAIDGGVARRLLETPAAVDGGSRIWGLRYNATTAQYTAAAWRYACDNYSADHVYFSLPAGDTNVCFELLGYTVSWNHASGAGDFDTLGHHGPRDLYTSGSWQGGERFSFVVPDGMFLVIHELAGTMSINDMPMSPTQRTVDYLFTDGERVIFNMMPGAWVSGVVCDPELAVPGARAKNTKTAK